MFKTPPKISQKDEFLNSGRFRSSLSSRQDFPDESEFTTKLKSLPMKIETFKTLFLNKEPKFLHPKVITTNESIKSINKYEPVSELGFL